MLKFVLTGLAGAMLGGAGTLLLSERTESFAFATADGLGVLIYDCIAFETAELALLNARAAHRFFEAELSIQSEAQVAAMVVDMAMEDAGRAVQNWSATLQSADDLRLTLSRNLQATFGCRMVKAQSLDT